MAASAERTMRVERFGTEALKRKARAFDEFGQHQFGGGSATGCQGRTLMKHVIIVPYFSEPEIDRYLKIADRLKSFGKQDVDYEFMLAASPRIEPSDRLYQGFSTIAPCRHFHCPTKIFGYPQGPTAMFWDCLDHLSQAYDLRGGFGLWLESDMVPVKRDWLTRLSAEWSRADSPLILSLIHI